MPYYKLAGYNISYIQNHIVLFEDVNFTITQGDVLLIQGPNGSGKTTLMKIIAGLLKPSKGTFFFNNGSSHIESFIAYLDSTSTFNNQLTLRQYLTYWGIFYNGTLNITNELIGYSLIRMGLFEYQNRPIEHLSLGQRKRLSICKLLLSNRLIWLLDEPTIGLDKYWTSIFYDLLHEHTCTGGISIVVTHTEHRILNPVHVYLHKKEKIYTKD